MAKSMYFTDKGIMIAGSYKELAARLAGKEEYYVSRYRGHATIFIGDEKMEVERINESVAGMEEYFVIMHKAWDGEQEGKYVCAKSYLDAARELHSYMDGSFYYEVWNKDKSNMKYIHRNRVAECNMYHISVFDENMKLQNKFVDELEAIDLCDLVELMRPDLKDGWTLEVIDEDNKKYALVKDGLLMIQKN